MHETDAAIVKRARPKVRINCRGQRASIPYHDDVYFSRHMYAASLSLRPHQSTILQQRLCHPLTASKNHSPDQLALMYYWCIITKLMSMLKKGVHFHRQRYALCITIQKTHVLQIVVIQNMTSHCSLYDLEKSLNTIIFLLKLNASHVLKAFTQYLFYVLQSNINNCGK